MKGVSYITDENNHKKAVVIDIKTIERYDEELEDLFEGIIAKSRKNDEKIPLKKVINNLKKQVSILLDVFGNIWMERGTAFF